MTKSKNLSGVFTALITPFKKGNIDFPSVKKLVRQQLDGGVQGFVVNGTTGESPTLDKNEVEKLFKFIRKESDKSVPLVLGTGSNSTAEAVQKTKLAKKLKADAALIVVPYYNKPPQRALVAHYSAIAKAAQFPIILYNVPGRTVISMAAETILELAKNKNIIGIKEASGQIDLALTLVDSSPKGFLLSSGDDTTAIEFMLAGGHGVISVVSHVIPKELRALSDRARAGDATTREAYKEFDVLNRYLSLESNPIPVKMMLYLMGIISSPELRLPLLTLETQNKKRIQTELEKLGII